MVACATKCLHFKAHCCMDQGITAQLHDGVEKIRICCVIKTLKLNTFKGAEVHLRPSL